MVEFVCDPLPRNLVLATQFLAIFRREPPNSGIVLPARQIFSFLLFMRPRVGLKFDAKPTRGHESEMVGL